MFQCLAELVGRGVVADHDLVVVVVGLTLPDDRPGKRAGTGKVEPPAFLARGLAGINIAEHLLIQKLDRFLESLGLHQRFGLVQRLARIDLRTGRNRREQPGREQTDGENQRRNRPRGTQCREEAGLRRRRTGNV